MSYAITGWRYNRLREVTWEDGTLTGDAFITRLVRQEATVREGQAVGPVGGPFTYHRHLADPLSALVLITEQLETILTIQGDRPMTPAAPPDAIV